MGEWQSADDVLKSYAKEEEKETARLEGLRRLMEQEWTESDKSEKE